MKQKPVLLGLVILALAIAVLVIGLLLNNDSDDHKTIASQEKHFAPVTLQHEGAVNGAAWSPDGTRILTWNGPTADCTENCPYSAHLWDAATGTEIVALPHNTDMISKVQWNQDGTRVLTYAMLVDYSKSIVRLWDAVSGEELVKIEDADALNYILWNKDQTRLLSWGSNLVKVWDAATGEELIDFNHDAESSVWDAFWNADESLIMTYGSDQTIRVWDAADGSEKLSIKHDVRVSEAGWSEDETLIVSSENPSFLDECWESCFYGAHVWDAASGEKLFTVQHDSWMNGFALSSDNTRLLTWSADGSARLWDVSNGDMVAELRHTGEVTKAWWNADDSRILTISQDNTAKVWNAADGAEMFVLEHIADINNAVWNQDESRILTWSQDGMVKVWDAADGKVLLSLPHAGPVLNAQWDQNEKFILTRSNSSSGCSVGCQYTVWVWNAQTGEPLFTAAHESAVNGAVWNEPQDRVLIWAADGQAQIVDTHGYQMTALPLVDTALDIKPGHWAGEPALSFDVSDDYRITNFSASFWFGNGTCNYRLTREFDVMAGQTVSFGEFHGQFTSPTEISGTYMVMFCGDTLRFSSGDDPWNATWVGEN